MQYYVNIRSQKKFLTAFENKVCLISGSVLSNYNVDHHQISRRDSTNSMY